MDSRNSMEKPQGPPLSGCRWSTHDAARIRAYTSTELRDSLWPWLIKRGYAAESDEHVLEEFLESLGRRQAHLRPGLRLKRRWDSAEVNELSRRGELSTANLRVVNAVLGAATEPLLPL
jgi:hypothetical protein